VHADICAILRKHLGEQTVLGVAVPLLAGHIDAAKREEPFEGLTEKEIEKGFRELSSRYMRSDYHSTYIQRPLGRGGFMELFGDKYIISTTTPLDS